MYSTARRDACRDRQGCIGLHYVSPSDVELAGQGIAAECFVQALDHCRVQECRKDTAVHYTFIALMILCNLSMTGRLDPARFELQTQPLLVAWSTRKTLVVEIACTATTLDGISKLRDLFHCRHPTRE